VNSTRSKARAPGRAARGAAILAGPIAFAGPIAALLAPGCDYIDTPYTYVVVDDDYPAPPLVVYQAQWQAVAFTTPIPPGASSTRQSTVPASANTAWVVLAPGWDPSGDASSPTSYVVLQSRSGFGVHLNDTLHIPVDDADFAGNCAAGSVLTQPEADFITQFVFPGLFQGMTYDAATCTTTAAGDAGAE
jgi:hypothetical protein